MHYPISHTQAGQLVTVIATAATMLLLVFAASAGAEVTGAAAPSPVAVVESPASTESVPPATAAVESVEAPERVEAPEVVSAGDAASEGVESKARAVSAPAPPDLPSTSDLPSAGVASKATAATDQVSELAGKLSQDAAQTTASVTRSTEDVAQSTKTVAQTADPATPIGHVQQLSHRVLEETGEALHRGTLDLLTPDAVENPLPPAGALSGVDTGPSSLPAMAKLTSPPLAGSFPHEQAAILESLLAPHLAAPGDLETLGLMAQSAAGNPAAGVAPRTAAGAIGAFSGNVAQRRENVAPQNGNGPTRHPLSPQAVASGSAGPSFVPIVALLALLALAAPAILRRLGEVPACRAPVPPVCALERPG